MGPQAELEATDPSMTFPELTSLVAPTASGGAVAGARLCPNCSTMVAPNFKFCPTCGTTVDAAPQVARITGSGLPASRSQLTPAPAGKLTLVRPDGTEGGQHELVEGENQIGRSLGALFEADGYLSPVHAEMVLNAAGLVLRDANSLNGVYVKLTDEEEIYDGDVFRIGQELMRFDGIPGPQPLDDGTEILGSPNPGYWGRLAVIVGRDQDGWAFPLFGDAVIMGRERGDITFPEDGYVSGTHARVSMRDGRYYLSDLNSSNGTFLRIRGEKVIRSGSLVLMGQQLFRVAYQ